VAKGQEMNDQLRVRREKMDELRDNGIDPFGHRFERDYLAQELHDEFDGVDKEELNEMHKTATIAGRIVSKRERGRLALPIFSIVVVGFSCMFVKIS
jgi:Lysyl-tRNA synthetase (class II)